MIFPSMHSLEYISDRSYRNCPIIGVDSVFLDRGAVHGKLTRMFVASRNHGLWKNLSPIGHKMSVGFHGHHCDVTLKPFLGEVWNVKPDFLPAYNSANLNPKTCHTFWVKSYKYDRDKEKIGRGIFSDTKDEMICIDSSMRHLKNDLSMSATDLHSIYVPRDRTAAWIVKEGAESEEGEEYTWSNDDLENFDWAGIYQPMSVDYLKRLIAKMEEW